MDGGNCHDVSIKADFKRHIMRPIVIVFIVGILIRLVLMPLLTYNYDVSGWATVIQNIENGDGLYGSPGYYYPPVWGYFLGTVSFFMELAGMSYIGEVFTEAVPLESLWWNYYRPFITTIEFNFLIKIPLLLCDLVVAVLIYKLIMEASGEEKKATLGAALWLLCPIVVYMSAIQGQFDNLSALFLLLSVILLRKGRPFLSGAMISMAVLTKLFPIFVVFALFAYILNKQKGNNKQRTRDSGMFVCGIILAAVFVFMPQIIDGTLLHSLEFITNRIGSSSISGGSSDIISSIGYTAVILLQPIILVTVVYFAHKLYRSDGPDIEKRLMLCVLLTTAVTFVWIPAPQYLIIIIPFLAYYISMNGKKLMRSWIMISVGATLFALVMNNFSLLMSIAAFTDILDLSKVVEIMEWIQQPLMGVPTLFILIVITGVIQATGIWSIMYIWLKDRKRDPEMML